MKRSEMVKFITTELFYGSLSARVDNTSGMITELAEKDAEAVLKLVEKLGMLPPPTNTDVVTSRLVYCYYPEVSADDTYQLDKTNSQLWELEDE